MSTILGSDGKPAVEPEQTARPEANGRDKSETRDVRTVPTGVLFFNLCLCANGGQMNKMMLEQMQHQMQQQKIIVDPPEVQHLKAILEHQMMARDVMVGELNYRFRDVDERRLAGIKMEVVDKTGAPEVKISEEPV
jgi:hypothetical protein